MIFNSWLTTVSNCVCNASARRRLSRKFKGIRFAQRAGEIGASASYARPSGDIRESLWHTFFVAPRFHRDSRRFQRQVWQQLDVSPMTERLEDRTLLAAINVTTFADVVDGGDGVISLREAVTTANTNGEADTINLPLGTYTLTLAGSDNFNATGDLDLLSDGPMGHLVTIQGAGASSTIIQAGTDTTNGIDRVFDVRASAKASAKLTLDGVTVRHGQEGDGGGIFNSGTLTVTNSTISGNSADGGGGLSNTGTATVTNSTIAGNSAGGGGGGGIFNSGTVTVTNSTISGNSASNGGGIISKLGPLGTVTVNNTIITNSTGGNTFGDAFSGSSGNNLIGTIGVEVTGFDTTLADNGGPTLTHKLTAGSSAIDAGSNEAATGLTTDQRGFTPRNFNGTVDIGAFEFGATAPSTAPAVNLSVSANAGTGTETEQTVITVTATAASAVSGDQTVTLAVTGITAGDFSLTDDDTGTAGIQIKILNGQTSGTVTFTVVDDLQVEGSETATLTISNPTSGIALGATTSQDIAITDNARPRPRRLLRRMSAARTRSKWCLTERIWKFARSPAMCCWKRDRWPV